MFGNISKVIDIPKEEQHKYNNYNQRLDVENFFKVFEQNNFMETCKFNGDN